MAATNDASQLIEGLFFVYLVREAGLRKRPFRRYTRIYIIKITRIDVHDIISTINYRSADFLTKINLNFKFRNITKRNKIQKYTVSI